MNTTDGRIGRRDLLRSAGVLCAVGTGAAIGTETAAASTHYTTYTVNSGETFTRNITSDETFENVLIDATANNTDVQINAYGSNWTIRNVGIKGELTSDNAAAFRLQVNEGSTAVFENVYLGDGAVPGGHGGVFVPTTHEGVLRIRELNVQYWPDNGDYGSAPGRSERGGRGGLVEISRSYARNNNIAGFRLGTDRSVVRDSVVHVDGNVPANSGGAVNARGIWAKEGGSIRIENCDILLESNDASYCVWEGDDNSVSLARVIDSQVAARGGAEGKYRGNVETVNVGNDPTVEIPPDVPATAKEAALGRNLPKVIALDGGSSNDRLRYAFETTGEIAGTRSTESADTVSGGQASGFSAGASDVFRYSGRIKALNVDLPDDRSIAFVIIDRQKGRIRFRTGSRNSERYEYYVRVSGSIDPRGNVEGSDVYSDDEAKGYLVGKKNVDAYDYSGEIEALRVRLPDNGSTLSVDIGSP